MEILTVPNPLLRRKSKPVRKIDESVRRLAREMIAFAKKEGQAVGLAAPQVGKLLRIAVVWSTGSRRFLAMINPKIVWRSRRMKKGLPNSKNPLEGCLSVPRIWAKVSRHSVIKVSYRTVDDQTVIRKFRGFTGCVVQHEYDHLDGILFIDRAVSQKEKLYRMEKDGGLGEI